MPRAKSKDLREQVLRAYGMGMKTKEVSRVFGICPACARRWKQRFREDGETQSRPMGGKRHEKIDPEKLRSAVAQRPDATLEELIEMTGSGCGTSAMSQALTRLGITRKKSRSTPRSRTGPMSPRSGPSGKPTSRSSIPAG